MTPLLRASAASGLGGTGGDITWSMTIPDLGKNGLIVIAGIGREEGGETNPEEINVCYFNGVYLTRILDANINETGTGMYYLQYPNIPAAGTYTAGINFKDSPKQAEKKRGVSAAFSNIRIQAPEASNATTGSGSPRSNSITPTTNNALVLGSWGWRVGFANSWSGLTEIVTSRGDNSAGISLGYTVKAPPGAVSVTASATNPEDNGLVLAAFAPAKDQGGFLLNMV